MKYVFIVVGKEQNMKQIKTLRECGDQIEEEGTPSSANSPRILKHGFTTTLEHGWIQHYHNYYYFPRTTSEKSATTEDRTM